LGAHGRERVLIAIRINTDRHKDRPSISSLQTLL
jgi:hypothetical protein